jgi:hypothetical protein
VSPPAPLVHRKERCFLERDLKSASCAWASWRLSGAETRRRVHLTFLWRRPLRDYDILDSMGLLCPLMSNDVYSFFDTDRKDFIRSFQSATHPPPSTRVFIALLVHSSPFSRSFIPTAYTLFHLFANYAAPRLSVDRSSSDALQHPFHLILRS